MPFLLLLLIAAACFPERWPQPLAWIGIPDGSPALFAALTWLGAAGIVGAAFVITWQARWQVHAGGAALRRFVMRRRSLQAFQCAYLLIAVYLLGWGWTVETLCTIRGSTLVPGAELLILAPFFVPLLASWAIYFDVEHLLHDRPDAPAPHWRERWSFVLFHLRQNLALLVAPLALLVIDKGLRRLFPAPTYEKQLLVASVALLVVVFVGLPWILRVVLGLRPLPRGSLRDRLLACAGRLNFRCSDILLWDTRSGVANAVVAGIVPQLRYVILTDRLASELTSEEVEAVFGHEIGHVKHHHMLCYIGFLLLSIAVLAGAWTAARGYVLTQPAIAAALNLSPRAGGEFPTLLAELEVVPLVTITGAYIFVVFGFLSRRCERQADIFGCRAVSCVRGDCANHDDGAALAPLGRSLCPTGIRIFIEALEKVACINGISRNRPGWLQSWQHSTIARRVQFLQNVLNDPTLESRFQLRVACVKWGLLLTLLATLAALIATVGWEAVHLI
jgi:Zn-dependent protease with chaperone function